MAPGSGRPAAGAAAASRPRPVRGPAGTAAAVGVAIALTLSGCGSGGECDDKFPDCAECGATTCKRCIKNHVLFNDALGEYCGLNCSGSFAHCALTSPPTRRAETCATAGKLTCEQCKEGFELAVDKRTMLPAGGCKIVCTSEQLQAGCAPGSCSDANSCNQCLPGYSLATTAEASSAQTSDNLTSFRFLQSGPTSEVSSSASSCTAATKPVSMTFYMYRAQKALDYPPENTDLASAAGVMWYLHNEVVCRKQTCPNTGSPTGRHYDVTRVLRYKVTVLNTQAVFDLPPKGRQIGHFTQFDSGQCTEPSPEKCSEVNWKPYGYMVGCQKQASQAYYAPATQYGSYWYSLPGPCPSLKYDDPNKKKCAETEHGGRCDKPTGASDCTWTYEDAGEVSLNELSGINDLEAFCKDGNYEYDDDTDRGRGTDFWDNKTNAKLGGRRVQRLLQLFAKRYPSNQSALELPDPVCNGW